MRKSDSSLSRSCLRMILLQNPGSMAKIARELGITRQTVSMVMQGRATSARILEAARRIAQEVSA